MRANANKLLVLFLFHKTIFSEKLRSRESVG